MDIVLCPICEKINEKNYCDINVNVMNVIICLAARPQILSGKKKRDI